MIRHLIGTLRSESNVCICIKEKRLVLEKVSRLTEHGLSSLELIDLLCRVLGLWSNGWGKGGRFLPSRYFVSRGRQRTAESTVSGRRKGRERERKRESRENEED